MQEAGWYRGYFTPSLYWDGVFVFYRSCYYDIKEKENMDMKERLQELAEAARKRIDESEGLDKLNEVRKAS